MTQQAYIVGGGIAALATAILLIRDAGWAGQQIHIFEASEDLGGSLDGSGDPQQGYVIRGGRMFEAHFGCTFDLLKDIPTLQDTNISVTADIKRFTQATVTSSRCRLVVDRQRQRAPQFGLSLPDRWALLRLTQRSEASLAGMSIEDYFSPDFFESNFWIMWSTMFAFQSWHSLVECRRYMRRFMHLLPGFNRLEGIHRTRFNQYDAIIAPCVQWLTDRGVNFHLQAPVEAIAFNDQHNTVTELRYQSQGDTNTISIDLQDRVFITLGSMTEASSLGSMTTAPVVNNAPDTVGSWSLWSQLSAQSPQFGRPAAFTADTSRTLWDSFTVTMAQPDFFDFMQSFTGNPAGSGGLVTFKHSGWMLSVVLARQPHFANQPQDCWVFWGYGLHPWNNGDQVSKPMFECSGEEILRELSHHLGFDTETALVMFQNANCIPCHMPYITSQFMPRKPGDRPQVIPEGAANFACIGQFCELPDDTVFTVEYSVRTAQHAVAGLCGDAVRVTPLYKGYKNPGVIARALHTIARDGSHG